MTVLIEDNGKHLQAYGFRHRYQLSNIKHFFRVYIASSKHEEGENSRQLCKPET